MRKQEACLCCRSALQTHPVVLPRKLHPVPRNPLQQHNLSVCYAPELVCMTAVGTGRWSYLHIFALSGVFSGGFLEVLFKIAEILHRQLPLEHSPGCNTDASSLYRLFTSISSQSSSSTVRSTTSSSLRASMSTSCSAIDEVKRCLRFVSFVCDQVYRMTESTVCLGSVDTSYDAIPASACNE